MRAPAVARLRGSAPARRRKTVRSHHTRRRPSSGLVRAEDSTTPQGFNNISANYIGSDPTGTIAEPNTSGLHLVHSPHNIISGNLLSGNRQSGVFTSDQYSTDNHIVSNMIGTDPTGMVAV